MAKATSNSAKKAPAAPAPAKKPAQAPSVESKAQPQATSATKRNITHEDIALAAFIRWEKFGGDAETNWAIAERELRGH